MTPKQPLLVQRKTVPRISLRVYASGAAYVAFIFVSYMVPVLLNSLVQIDLGGLSTIALSDVGAATKYIFLWAAALAFFFLGSGIPTGRIDVALPPVVKSAMWLFLGVTGPILIALKVELAAQGVYDAYAFDTGAMVGGVWSMSTALSEMVLYAFAMALLLKDRWLMLISFALLSLNLLHGTRIFTVCALSIFIFWWIATHRVRLRSVAIAVVVAMAIVLGSLGVFLQRSNVDLSSSDATEVAQYVVSPVLYESVFSQISLIALANGDPLEFRCNPVDFVFDLASFLTPRALNPGKDKLCIDYLSELQFLGALNGVFGAFGYFQWFFGVLFIAFGLTGRWLFRVGRKNIFFLSLAIYFFGSISVRLLRDGPILAAKFLSVAVFASIVLFAMSRLPLRRRKARVVARLPATTLSQAPNGTSADG